jgi:hypothetical protein
MGGTFGTPVQEFTRSLIFVIPLLNMVWTPAWTTGPSVKR